MTYTARFAGCDETRHPRCGGVVTPAAVEKAGFATKDEAHEYSRDVLGEVCTAKDVADDEGQLLNSADPSTILRDYVLIDESSGEVADEGEHDDYDLFG